MTDAGQLFLKYARSSLATLDEGIQAVRSQDGVVRGRLHLGILQSLEPYIDLPVLLDVFRTKYPDVEFAVRSLDTDTIPAHVRSGYVDLSFHALVGEKIGAGLKVIPFSQDSLVAICAREHSLATRRGVGLDLLKDETFVDLTHERALRKLVDRSFAEDNAKRHSVYQVSDVETMLQFVESGLGVAIVPSALAHLSARLKQIHILPITTPGRRLTMWRIVIVTRAQRRHVLGKTTVDLFLETLGDLQSTASS